MAALSSTTTENIQDLLDHQVVDQAGNEIGILHSFWADPDTGKLEFLGVKTGWLFGRNHVLPVDRVELDEATHTVRVPYDAEFVKGATSIDANSEITDEEEAEIYRYYNVRTRGAAATNVSADAATDRTSNTSTATPTRGTEIDEAGYAARTNADLSDRTTPKPANPATATTAAVGTVTDKDSIEVPLTEEQVKVGKRTVDAGQVRLRKIVRTEVVNQPVEVRREDVVVERIPAGEVREGAATDAFKEEVIDVPLHREEAVVSKEAHVTGAVRLKKTAETETQQVSEQVRKEDVEVLRDGKTIVEQEGK